MNIVWNSGDNVQYNLWLGIQFSASIASSRKIASWFNH